jgi:CRISPR-associated protein Csd2
MTAIKNRYEFVYLFDVKNGNPNGDPDNGNMPRLENETQRGLVTDVCLKRKIRNYIDTLPAAAKPEQNGKAYNIYMRERAVLNDTHREAYNKEGLKPERKKLPKDTDKAAALTRWMCDQFYDIRTFGAVMTTEVNCGQVRGPVQIAFGESIDPIVPQEITITRSSVTNVKDAEKERTMGRKHIVSYGLYRTHGYISASLAGDNTKGTGFSEADLELFWKALENMFDHDRSAARGEMTARKLYVFKHSTALGNARAQLLFDLIEVKRKEDVKVPRSFADYVVSVRGTTPDGVELIEKF